MYKLPRRVAGNSLRNTGFMCFVTRQLLMLFQFTLLLSD
jgi:hypothetical protein